MGLFSAEDLARASGKVQPVMAEAKDVPHTLEQRALLPTNDRAKRRYDQLASLFPETDRMLAALPGRAINLEDIGFLPGNLQLRGKELHFALQHPAHAGTLAGKVKDIGMRRIMLLAESRDDQRHANYVIESLGLACTGIAKFRLIDRELFPATLAVDPEAMGEANGGSSGPGHNDHPSYHQFVGTLFEAADEIWINPNNFQDGFANYQIYVRSGISLAYNSAYGQAAYISTHSDDFFDFSKTQLRAFERVTRIIRNEEGEQPTWQNRILEALLV